MNIAQVCPTYAPHIGGVESHVRAISKNLIDGGIKVTVITTDPSGRLPRVDVIDGITVLRFNSLAPSDAYYFSPDLQSYLKKHNAHFDVVHAHNYHAFPSLYASQIENKLVFTPHYHGTGDTFLRSLLHLPYKWVGKSIFNRASNVICVSNYEKNLVLKDFKINENKITLIPNGLNLKEFVGLTPLPKNKKESRIILTVSRLEKYKGIQYIIQILPLIDSDINLEIIGQGAYKETLRSLANKLNVSNRVRFIENLPRSELLSKYVNADLYISLSDHEAYGLTVAEALSAGTSCIVVNKAALSEWVDNKNCFGVEYPIDILKLRTLVNDVIGNRATDSQQVLDWMQVTKRLIAVYDTCVNN